MIAFILCFILAPRESLQKLAVQYEILDPRETHYLLASDVLLKFDFKIIVNRYNDLKTAPPLSDCNRYPKSVTDILNFNRSYRTQLECEKTLYRQNPQWFIDALAETDELHAIWDLVRDANSPYYYVHIRRIALRKLKQKLGDDAYYGGALPPPVPIWRFQRF